jgi:hypothetical protein
VIAARFMAAPNCLSDVELDKNPLPYLATRRWVRERYAQ